MEYVKEMKYHKNNSGLSKKEMSGNLNLNVMKTLENVLLWISLVLVFGTVFEVAKKLDVAYSGVYAMIVGFLLTMCFFIRVARINNE